MHDASVLGPDPQAIPPGLLHDFGDRWDIRHLDNGVWIAIRRPTITSYELHAAYSADELRAKLAAAEQEGNPS